MIILYSNHPETIIEYFVTNINKHKHNIKARASGAGISFIATASVYIITIKKLQQWINNKAKLQEMPSSGSYITYKILNSLIAPRDSSYCKHA